MAYTTSNLISAIERRSFSPADADTFTQSEILSIATEELQSTIIPELIKLREGFNIVSTTISLTTNTNSYPIPDRCFSSILREVKLVRGSVVRDLPRMELEQVERTSSRTGVPEYFYLKGNSIILYPTPSNTDYTLEVDFYISPSELVLPSETAIVTGINTSTNVVSFSSIPSTFLTGTTHDFIGSTGEHRVKGVEYKNTLVSGTDITFSTLPSDLAVGDYVTIAGENSLISLPVVMRNVLAQLTAGRVLMHQSASGADQAYKLGQKMLQESVEVLSPRVHGAVRHIAPSVRL